MKKNMKIDQKLLDALFMTTLVKQEKMKAVVEQLIMDYIIKNENEVKFLLKNANGLGINLYINKK